MGKEVELLENHSCSGPDLNDFFPDTRGSFLSNGQFDSIDLDISGLGLLQHVQAPEESAFP